MLRVASDKSITHRAFLLGALAQGTTLVRHPLLAEDTEATLSCLERLGVGIRRQGQDVAITGAALQPAVLDCKNAGTLMRLLMGILATQDFESTLIGDASLIKRPMQRVAEPLRMMGASIDLDAGHAPVRILKPVRESIKYQMPIASAQVKSAIMLAHLGINKACEIQERTLSRDHLERMLPFFGVPVRHDGCSIFMEAAPLGACEIAVPADPSSAAPFIAGALLRAPIELTDVCLNPTRLGFVETLRSMGASITMHDVRQEFGESIGLMRITPSQLTGVRVPASQIPSMIDELMLLALLATQAKGTTVLERVGELRFKESDRLSMMVEILRSMGAKIHCSELDDVVIEGGVPLHGIQMDAKQDHRIAMLGAIANLLVPMELIGADCVAVSYPDFFAHMGMIS